MDANMVKEIPLRIAKDFVDVKSNSFEVVVKIRFKVELGCNGMYMNKKVFGYLMQNGSFREYLASVANEVIKVEEPLIAKYLDQLSDKRNAGKEPEMKTDSYYINCAGFGFSFPIVIYDKNKLRVRC